MTREQTKSLMLEVALGECVVELTNLCDLTRFECGNGRLAIMHAQALLNK